MTDQACHEDIADQAIDQSAGADVHAPSRERPHRDARSQVDRRVPSKTSSDRGTARRSVPARVEVGEQVIEVATQQRRGKDAGEPGQLARTNAEILGPGASPIIRWMNQSRATKPSESVAAKRKLARERSESVNAGSGM
jgi:hypothetical protein